MSRLFALGAALTIMAASAAPAAAGPYTIESVYEPSPPVCLSVSSDPCNAGAPSQLYIEYAHYFTLPDGGTITAAELNLTLVDDGGSRDGNEKIDLVLDGTPVVINANANHDLRYVFPSFSSLYDGTLSVKLQARDGDFFFVRSTLRVTDPVNGTVPAPATLLLLGSGLTGLGVLVHRRSRRAG